MTAIRLCPSDRAVGARVRSNRGGPDDEGRAPPSLWVREGGARMAAEVGAEAMGMGVVAEATTMGKPSDPRPSPVRPTLRWTSCRRVRRWWGVHSFALMRRRGLLGLRGRLGVRATRRLTGVQGMTAHSEVQAPVRRSEVRVLGLRPVAEASDGQGHRAD